MSRIGDTITREMLNEHDVKLNREKNQRRRDGKSNGSLKERVEGKRLRKVFGGSFGRSPKRVYEVCMMGTSVLHDERPESHVPKDHRTETATDRTDYDS